MRSPDVQTRGHRRRRFWLLAAGAAAVGVVAGGLIWKQVNGSGDRYALTPAEEQRRAAAKGRRAELHRRYALFDALQPVAVVNCGLQRFGEPHDGGYLMCGNLLGDAQAGYSYGISGYDKWGCDISTKLDVPVHQYDCFDTTRPACPAGRTVFHQECVGPATTTVEGRIFDTIPNQLAKNGDSSKRIVLKIDVEGAEWASLAAIPDEMLGRIDQLAVEFHWKHDGHLQWYDARHYLPLVERLKRFFEVAHVHYNNAACVEGLEPFPTWAYEVLFVSKRLARVDPSRNAGGLHPLDARNDPRRPDCQPNAGAVRPPSPAGLQAPVPLRTEI